MYIDTHIHLSHHRFDESFPYVTVRDGGFAREEIGTRKQIIEEAMAAGVGMFLEPGIEPASNEKLLALSREYMGVIFPAVGVHPTRCVNVTWDNRKQIEQLSALPEVVAIGELGLDYHLERKEQHRLKQHAWFIYQLLLAHKRNLPLILHIRDADRDAIRVLRLFRKYIHGGICHCYAGNAETASIYTEEFGLMLGIGGTILQDKDYARDLAEAVRVTPLERMVLETDGPYVSPERPEGISKKQWMKTRNTSLIIPEVAKRIAAIKGIAPEEVERVTTANARKLFCIDHRL